MPQAKKKPVKTTAKVAKSVKPRASAKPKVAKEPKQPAEKVPQLIRSTKSTKAQAARPASKKAAVSPAPEPTTAAAPAYVGDANPLADKLEDVPVPEIRITGSKPAPARPANKPARSTPASRTATGTSAASAKKSLFKLSASSKARPRRSLKKLATVAAAVLLIGSGGYLLWQYRTQSPAEILAADKQLIAEVNKRVVVPSGETPAISTIVDERKVDQEFLRGTKKGDKVLLYFQAGRAIVYRPSTGQVINTGPLDAPSPRVFVRSGTANPDISRIIAAINASQQFALDSRDSSPKLSYPRTVVVDLAGNRPDVAKKLADVLKATVAPLPPGESRPDADLLVLVGSDYAKP